MTKAIVRLALTCPEIKGVSIPYGKDFGFRYTWILVTGGALALGSYDPWRSQLGEPNVDLPKQFRLELTSRIDEAINDSIWGLTELNVRVADSFMHTPCILEAHLKNRRLPERGAMEQAPITFRRLLELNKSQRSYNKRSKLSLEQLELNVYDLGTV